MNLFLFVFSIAILICFLIAVKKFGISESFISEFTMNDLDNVSYDIEKNGLIVSMRHRDFWDCALKTKPNPTKSNFEIYDPNL